MPRDPLTVNCCGGVLFIFIAILLLVKTEFTPEYWAEGAKILYLIIPCAVIGLFMLVRAIVMITSAAKGTSD